MNRIEIYHGGTEIIKQPLCHVGRDNLDFGRGFYLTDIKEQAMLWANRMANLRGEQAVINIYSFNKKGYMMEANCKIFEIYNQDWLRFIVANRMGENAAESFDYVEGGVANDRVINSINLYMQGYLSEELTLRRLSEHRPNNQICLRNQELINKHLRYERSENI